ncbi:MAG: MFS transporter [Aliidongia sp.]
MAIEALSGWTKEQRHVVAASFLGWTLDAFDFFLMVFVFSDIEKEFDAPDWFVAFTITLTLGVRPLGALIFGRAADHFGRRPTLMVDVILYAILDFASGFAPNLTTLLILRALFGVAMGGEWGVGASLTMESIPPKARGLVSGLLQSGYPTGFLLASVVYGLLYSHIGWRGLFMVGAAPAFLVLYIRRHVPESPGWERSTEKRGSILDMLRQHWKLAILCRAVDDRIQLLQPWHAGRISEQVPERPARAAAARDQPDHDHLQYRRDLRRAQLRLDLRMAGAALDHHHRVAAVDPRHPVRDALDRHRHGHDRRVPDPVHGARCLGRRPGPSQRVVA